MLIWAFWSLCGADNIWLCEACSKPDSPLNIKRTPTMASTVFSRVIKRFSQGENRRDSAAETPTPSRDLDGAASEDTSRTMEDEGYEDIRKENSELRKENTELRSAIAGFQATLDIVYDDNQNLQDQLHEVAQRGKSKRCHICGLPLPNETAEKQHYDLHRFETNEYKKAEGFKPYRIRAPPQIERTASIATISHISPRVENSTQSTRSQSPDSPILTSRTPRRATPRAPILKKNRSVSFAPDSPLKCEKRASMSLRGRSVNVPTSASQPKKGAADALRERGMARAISTREPAAAPSPPSAIKTKRAAAGTTQNRRVTQLMTLQKEANSFIGGDMDGEPVWEDADDLNENTAPIRNAERRKTRRMTCASRK